MEVLKLKDLGQNLENFIYESRKFILRTLYDGLSARVLCFDNHYRYEYITMVPNSSCGNRPVDFLAIIKDKKILKSFIVVGEYLTEISVLDYKKVLEKIEHLIELDGYTSDENKLKKIRYYYYESLFEIDTINKIDDLLKIMDMNLDNSSKSLFIKKYYSQYQDIEEQRKNRVDKILTKK